MATNILDTGRTINYTAGANVTAGNLVLAGVMFGIAKISGVSGDVIPLETGCTAVLPKLNVASGSFAVGANVYWDNTNGNCTVSATSNTRIGVAVVAASNTVTSVTVRLNGSF
jgi:predicted RecA/RadA family phage recombinase